MVAPPRSRRQGIDVVPPRVRQAIAEAGLSFGALAKESGVSRQTMYNVASGKARPSAPVLEHIARMTGRGVEFFLADTTQPHSSTQVGELQILCASKQHERAIALGESILTGLTDAIEEAEVRLCLAEAYAAMGRAQPALENVEPALEFFQGTGDRPKQLMCMDWKAVAIGIAGGDPTNGLLVAEEALAECRRLNPVPVQTEVAILQHMAAMQGMRREYRLAAQLIEQAIAVATEIAQTPWQLARLYQNQGIVYHKMGLLAQASQMVQRALALYTLADNAAGIAQMEGNFGDLLLTLGSYDRARGHLERALELSEGLGLERVAENARLSQGTLDLRTGEWDLAECRLTEALRTAEARGEKTVMASAHHKLGQLATCRRQPAVVDREYGVAIQLYEELEIPVQARQCHREYAEALEDRGDLAAALPHLKAATEDDEATVSFRLSMGAQT